MLYDPLLDSKKVQEYYKNLSSNENDVYFVQRRHFLYFQNRYKDRPEFDRDDTQLLRDFFREHKNELAIKEKHK